MVGRNLGPYHIVALIGRGGMGEVYRARDTRLDRDVALKVLPGGTATDPGALGRFRREAKTLAGLNHPHIVTLFSVEESDNLHFLTMELVEGQTLQSLLAQQELPLARILDVGSAVADALGAAHEKGIVHRDLKPANVMVTKEGRVKVLDFGLAKLLRPVPARFDDDTAVLTTQGAVMGTFPYMSPEQVRGEAVDARTDLFSLGTMLYQMIGGRLPFQSDYPHEVAYAITNKTPEPLAHLRAGVPVPLAQLVLRCLEKDPACRPASAAAVRDELRALRAQMDSGALQRHRATGRGWMWAAVLAGALVLAGLGLFIQRGRGRAVQDNAPASIAVLPFANMSGDQSQEFFSDGVSEELLNLLTQVHSLKVAARTSSFSFKGKEVDVPEIARRLKVTHVLEGSVRRSQGRVRITAQLVHASDGYQMWSQTYDRQLGDIFAVQDDIAADVVKHLSITLLGEAPKSRSTDPLGYGLYLQANQMAHQLTPRALQEADSLYRQAVQLDPQFAPAWERLSFTLQLKSTAGIVPFAAGFGQARDAANHAIAIDPDYAPAHATLGRIAMWGDNDFATAARHLERALTLSPTDPYVLSTSGLLLKNLGRFDDAIAVLKFDLARDPLNVGALHYLADAQALSGRDEEALQTFRTVIGLNPERAQEYFGMGAVLLRRGDAQGALELFQKTDDEVLRLLGTALACHALGRKSDSDAALTSAIAKYQKEAAYNIAWVYAFREEPDRAFEWLERAVEYEDSGLSEIAPDPFLDNLRTDPRWVPFLRRIGKAPEQLSRIEFRVALPPG